MPNGIISFACCLIFHFTCQFSFSIFHFPFVRRFIEIRILSPRATQSMRLCHCRCRCYLLCKQATVLNFIIHYVSTGIVFPAFAFFFRFFRFIRLLNVHFARFYPIPAYSVFNRIFSTFLFVYSTFPLGTLSVPASGVFVNFSLRIHYMRHCQ